MEKELHNTGFVPRDFTFHLLEQITNNFSEENRIGFGGYGAVYKGVLDNGVEVAVKKLYFQHPELDDGKQFLNECTNLTRVQHQNIVRLIGYCYEIRHKFVEHNGKTVLAELVEKALCFEYLQGGSLDRHISDESCELDWSTCYKIIKGICEGLNYLHNGSKESIFHLDLKPANILLDRNMMPKIGDFGLSRLFDSTQTCTTKGIIGTPGYMPPEYINRFQITPKFDVFSLGNIIIKMIAGPEGYSKCADMPFQEFIDLVHENWEKRFRATMSFHTSHGVKKCIDIALRCVEVDRVKRPTIAEIVDELNKFDINIVNELNMTDTTKYSPTGQVTNLQSKQAYDQSMNFGSAGESSLSTLTAVSNTRNNVQQMDTTSYGDEGRSMGTEEKQHKTLEHEVHDENAAEGDNTEDPGRRSGGLLDRLRSAWAGISPTSKAAYVARDGLLWWRDLARVHAGQTSVAVVQANNIIEDQCFIESAAPFCTVIGVFDGHGGAEAARFACDHLLPNLRAASGPLGMTVDAIRTAFLATEGGFMALVSRLWETRPSIAVVGSCCLVGVVHQMTLFVANLGDSRAVLGKVSRTREITAEQLSFEHNVSYEDARQELHAEHPDDPNIVAFKHGVWRVKGIIQVSRSIGDACMKFPQYNADPIPRRFRISEPFSRPLLSAEPSIVTHTLQPSDRFVIFASDGLWEYLTNQEAVEIVHKHKRAGSARRLVEAALREAAKKYEMRYTDLFKIDRGIRRHFHDDITVVVLFIDHYLMEDYASIRIPLDNQS